MDMDDEKALAFLNGIEEVGTISERDMQILSCLTDCPESIIRARAAALLVLSDGETGQKLLIKLSQDHEAEVRLEAYDSLAVFPNREVENVLSEAIRRESNDLARCYALLSWAEVSKTLEENPDEQISVLESLREQAESEQFTLCLTYALYLLGKSEAFNHLLRFLTSNDYHIRCMTISLLEELLSDSNKDRITEEMLRLLNTDRSAAVRARAAELVELIEKP